MFNFVQSNKVALAHDTFTQLGGAERVVAVFHEIFPDAPVFVLVESAELKEKFKAWDIRTSSLQTLFLAFPKLQYFLPLIPSVLDSWEIGDYDLLLSSSSSFIKNIRVPKNTTHICYCHTPTRFLWHDHDYIDQELPWFLVPIKPLIKFFLNKMRNWDYARAQKINFFIANSLEVQKRIKKYYNRDSEVIYPPVDTNFWTPSGMSKIASSDALLAMTDEKQNYFLLAGRLQAHKQNDLIVQIFNELGLPLHVVGTGRQEAYLRSIAKPNITFYGLVSNEELRNQYRAAKALVYPQIEDAGLMPLEAAACGTAAIGLAKGGSLETIIPGITGELFADYDKEKIKQLIIHWDSQKYSLNNLRSHAEKFNTERFKRQIMEFIQKNENSN